MFGSGSHTRSRFGSHTRTRNIDNICCSSNCGSSVNRISISTMCGMCLFRCVSMFSQRCTIRNSPNFSGGNCRRNRRKCMLIDVLTVVTDQVVDEIMLVLVVYV